MKKHKAIRILKQVDTDLGWQFTVGIDGTTYAVTLSQDYWQRLTAGRGEPSRFIEASFKYLLDREPKEQILSEFDLSQIELYFPSYPGEIITYL